MIISDLTYLETAIEANNLEGGILSYTEGALFAQRYQTINSGVIAGPNGTIVTGQVVDVRTFTAGGLNVTF